MLATPLGTVLVAQPLMRVFVAVCIMALQLSRLSKVWLLLATIMELSCGHEPKAITPMVSTEGPMATEARLLHSRKAYSPILVMVLGTMSEVMPVFIKAPLGITSTSLPNVMLVRFGQLLKMLPPCSPGKNL